MIKEVNFTGKTLDEAWENACEKLGLDPDEKVYQVVRMPKKGFLGLGNQLAEIAVEIEVPDEPKKEVKKAVKEEKKTEKKETKKVEKEEKKAEKVEEPKKRETRLPTEDEKKQIAAAEKYLCDVIKALGVEKFETTYEIVEKDTIVFDLIGEDLGVVIGRRGETLDALQYLCGLVANRNGDTYFRVSLGSGDFRKNREETLKNLAKKKAQYVLKNHRSASLEPMNPYERRIIHSTITEIEGVHSKSVGSDPNRKVVIFPNDRHGEGERRNNNRGRRDNRGRGRNDRDRKPSQRVDSKPREGAPLQDEASVSLYAKIEL